MELADWEVNYVERPLNRGLERRFEWRGPHNVPVRVTRDMLRDLMPQRNGESWPSRLSIDGVPLKCLPGSERYTETFIYNAALYMRLDGTGWFWWLYHVIRRPILRGLWFVYERSILTLHVWGLADYPLGCRPSWRDIKLFRR